MRRFPKWAWVAVAVVVVAVTLNRTACAPRALTVGVAVVNRGPVEELVANSEAGSVRARRAAKLACDRAGRVGSIVHREGEAVREGELLLQLDSTTAGAALHAARHEFDVASALEQASRAAARLAGDQYARAASLRDQAVLSTEQFEEARSRRDAAAAELHAAEARVEAAEAAIRVQSNELAHLRLHAPFTGVLSRRYVEVGEALLAGQPAFELVGLEHLYVTAPIDERDAGALRPGQAVRVTLDAYPGAVWPASLTRVSDVAEEARQQNRTVEVEVDLPVLPDHPVPRPGLTADVEIVLSRRDSVLRVPTSAVMDGRRVLRLQGGRARAAAVTIGVRNWDWSEVREGLATGDRVVTTLDRAGVKDGVPVRPEPPPESARR